MTSLLIVMALLLGLVGAFVALPLLRPAGNQTKARSNANRDAKGS